MHTRIRVIAGILLALFIALTTSRPAWARQDLDALKPDYSATVTEKLSSEALDGLDPSAAKEIILKVAALPDPRALDKLLAPDAKKVAERLAEWGVKLEKAKMAREQFTKALKDAPQDQRTTLEAKVKDAETDLAKAKLIFPQLRELNAAMTEGLLLAIETIGTARPAEVWSGLVEGLRSDMTLLAQVDDETRSAEAKLKSVREKLAGAQEAERDELEKQGAELAGKVAAGKEQFVQLEKLRVRRIDVLAKSFSSLDKNRQAKELAGLKANLKDEAPAELRTFAAELYGALPAPDAHSTPLAVMKKASNERDKVEKELTSLRETYERASKALTTAIIGGNGLVPTSVVEAERAAADKLRKASMKSAELARIVAAAARGLGRAIAAMEPAARQKPANELLKLAQTYSDKIVRNSVLAAFALVKDEKIQASLRNLAAKDPEVNTRLAALEVLAEMGDPATVELCANTMLKDEEWRIRAAAMRALVRIPSKVGVAALIASLRNEVGRLVEDAEQALSELTGQHFSGDAALWADWWTKNEATFDPAAVKKADDLAAAGDAPAEVDWRKSGGHVSFYGITTRSNRILFVLDRSGSMEEPATDSKTGKGSGSKKIDVAKAQLVTAINGLADGDMFNLVHYSADVDRWTKTMQKSSAETRKKAANFVEKEIVAVGGTNIYDALREAFRLAGIGGVDKAYQSNVDTIFFLTDGEPTQGEVLDTKEILRRVREWNKLSRIVVHAVGVGKDHDSAFLRRLAEENGGTYVSR
jgi:von Willebrand factor type A domain/HEAT repeats